MNKSKSNVHKPQALLHKRAQKGSVLVVCVGVLAIISLMAVVFITAMRTQQDISANLKYVTEAKIAARAGLNHALSLIDQHAQDSADATTSLDDDWFSAFCYTGTPNPADTINQKCFQFDVKTSYPDDPKDQNFDPYPAIDGNLTLNGKEVNFDGRAKWFEFTTDPVEGSNLTRDNKVKTRYAVLTIDLSGRLLAQPATWEAGKDYKKGQVVYGRDAGGIPIENREYLCTSPGTSGASEPNWGYQADNSDIGNSVSDSGVTWKVRFPVQAARLGSLLQSGRIDSQNGVGVARGGANVFKENSYSWLQALDSFRYGFTLAGADYPYSIITAMGVEPSYGADLNRIETYLTPFGEPLLADEGKTDLAFGPVNINTAPRAVMNSMILNACGPLSRQVWQKNHDYEVGDVVRPTLDSDITGEYVCINAGRSDLIQEPRWYDAGNNILGIAGEQILDNGVIWKRLGSTFPEWEAGMDYEVGDIIRPRSVDTQDPVNRLSPLAYLCTKAGVSNNNPANEPDWLAVAGAVGNSITNDGSVDWIAIAPVFLPGVRDLKPSVAVPAAPDEIGDGASTLCWRPGVAYKTGDIVQPTNPKGYYYKAVADIAASATEPNWPENGNGVGSWSYAALLPPNWTPRTKYAVGDWVRPTSAANSTGGVEDMYYQCTDAGVSGNTEPAWPTSGTVTEGSDNQITWTCQGLQSYHWRQNTVYSGGDLIRVTDPDKEGYIYECNYPGSFTSGTIEPAWPTRLGESTYEIPDNFRGEWKAEHPYNFGDYVLRPAGLLGQVTPFSDKFNPQLRVYRCTTVGGGTSGKAPRLWSSSSSYNSGDVVWPNAQGAKEGTIAYRCTSGNSPDLKEPGLGNSPPNPWPLTGGATITEGGLGDVQWECEDKFWSSTPGDTFSDGALTWRCEALPTWVCRGAPVGALSDRERTIYDLEGTPHTITGRDFNADLAYALMQSVEAVTYKTGSGNYPLTGVSVLEDEFKNKLHADDALVNAYNSGWSGDGTLAKPWTEGPGAKDAGGGSWTTRRMERAANDTVNSLFYNASKIEKDYDGSQINFNKSAPSTWNPNTDYNLGDTIRSSSLKYEYECVSKGTSGSSPPNWAGCEKLGDIIVDPPLAVPAAGEVWQAGKAYAVHEIIKPNSLSPWDVPSNYYFEATTAGTSGAGVPSPPDFTVATTPGDTVSDNGVVWTLRQRVVWRCKRVNSVPALHDAPDTPATETGATNLAADESRTGEFWQGKSHYFYVRVRGEAVREKTGRVLSRQNCEAVIYVPDYAAHPDFKPRILYQRWFVE